MENIIKDPNLQNVLADVIEVGIDSVTDSESLKDVPLLGGLVSIMRFTSAFSERMFVKKLLRFLSEINEVPHSIREKQIEKINSDPSYGHKVGEKLLDILSKIDADNKPAVVGRLFKNFLQSELDYLEFLRLSHIVDRAFFFDLKVLENYDEYDYFYGTYSGELVSLSLVSKHIDGWSKGKDPGKGCTGEITGLGKKLFIFGLKESI